MLSSSDSDDDDVDMQSRKFFFWNNWNPPNMLKCSENKKLQAAQVNPPSSNIGCWLPPVNFGQRIRKKKEKVIENKTNVVFHGEFNIPFNHFDENWGPIFPYYKSLASFEESETYFFLLHPSIFGTFKLWKNEYENICCFGEGEFENGINDETGVLIVNREQLLRKLLGVSNVEWLALLEAVKNTKSILHFDAFRLRNENSLPTLEKLWVFLCKRRHHLPCVSIKVRRSGVKKLTQYLKILPKFVVEEIRHCDGSDTL